jgi:hypothetical protein
MKITIRIRADEMDRFLRLLKNGDVAEPDMGMEIRNQIILQLTNTSPVPTVRDMHNDIQDDMLEESNPVVLSDPEPKPRRIVSAETRRKMSKGIRKYWAAKRRAG